MQNKVTEYNHFVARVWLNDTDYARVRKSDLPKMEGYNWIVGKDGKVAAPDSGKWVFLHRFLAGAKPGQVVVFQDRNNRNFMPKNLIITDKENHDAVKKVKPGPTSKYRGVSWHKTHNKWQVGICVKGKDYYLGEFEDEIEAAQEYNKAVQKWRAPTARLNKIPPRCLFSGCNRPIKSKGYCDVHYNQKARYGAPIGPSKDIEYKSMVGKKYGYIRVISIDDETTSYDRPRWICKCIACGRLMYKTKYTLKTTGCFCRGKGEDVERKQVFLREGEGRVDKSA